MQWKYSLAAPDTFQPGEFPRCLTDVPCLEGSANLLVRTPVKDKLGEQRTKRRLPGVLSFTNSESPLPVFEDGSGEKPFLLGKDFSFHFTCFAWLTRASRSFAMSAALIQQYPVGWGELVGFQSPSSGSPQPTKENRKLFGKALHRLPPRKPGCMELG